MKANFLCILFLLISSVIRQSLVPTGNSGWPWFCRWEIRRWSQSIRHSIQEGSEKNVLWALQSVLFDIHSDGRNHHCSLFFYAALMLTEIKFYLRANFTGQARIRRYTISPVIRQRKEGVRRVNVYKNTGKIYYAFNSLQRSMLPPVFRPPESTTGKVQN